MAHEYMHAKFDDNKRRKKGTKREKGWGRGEWGEATLHVYLYNLYSDNTTYCQKLDLKL